MNSIYTVENYKILKKQAISELIAGILLIFVGIAFVLLSGFIINDKNVVMFKIIDSFYLTLTISVGLYFLIERFGVHKTRLAFVYKLLAVSRYQGKVKVLKVSNKTLIRRGICGYEITVLGEDEKEAIYYLEDLMGRTFVEGDLLNITVASGFITEYEKENEHE